MQLLLANLESENILLSNESDMHTSVIKAADVSQNCGAPEIQDLNDSLIIINDRENLNKSETCDDESSFEMENMVMESSQECNSACDTSKENETIKIIENVSTIDNKNNDLVSTNEISKTQKCNRFTISKAEKLDSGIQADVVHSRTIEAHVNQQSTDNVTISLLLDDSVITIDQSIVSDENNDYQCDNINVLKSEDELVKDPQSYECVKRHTIDQISSKSNDDISRIDDDNLSQTINLTESTESLPNAIETVSMQPENETLDLKKSIDDTLNLQNNADVSESEKDIENLQETSKKNIYDSENYTSIESHDSDNSTVNDNPLEKHVNKNTRSKSLGLLVETEIVNERLNKTEIGALHVMESSCNEMMDLSESTDSIYLDECEKSISNDVCNEDSGN